MGAELIVQESAATELAGEYAGRAGAMLLEAHQLAVVDASSAAQAVGLRGAIKADDTAAELARTRLVKPLNDHVRWINSVFKQPAEVREKALGVVNKKLVDYQTEQERLAKAAADAAAEIQRKEEERLRKLAEKAEARGDEEKAIAYTAKADLVTLAAPVVKAPAAPEGISFREDWSAEIYDKEALLKGVLLGVVPPAAIEPNMTYLHKAAKSMKGTVAWPGVKWVKTPVPVSKGGIF